MSGLFWFQTIWHSDGIPERNLWKSWLWTYQQMTKMHAKLPSMQEISHQNSSYLEVIVTVFPSVFACWLIFHFLSSVDFFKINFSKKKFRISIWVSNSLYPDQSHNCDRPDMGLNCLREWLADETKWLNISKWHLNDLKVQKMTL